MQATSGDVEKALTTAKSIPEGVWKQWALADVVQSRALAGDPFQALSLTRRMESATDRRAALEHLADGLSHRLDLEQGWKKVKAPYH
jgi:hypothetical protein